MFFLIAGSTDAYIEATECTVNCYATFKYDAQASSTFERILCNSPLCDER